MQSKAAMLDLATEREHLAQANRDIADGEMRIGRQVALVERLRANGHSPTDAEKLLATLRHTLQTWQDHRQEILRAIARLESAELSSQGEPPRPAT